MGLGTPATTSGHGIGASAAFVGDLDGDGSDDLALGTPLSNVPLSPWVRRGVEAGAVHLYSAGLVSDAGGPTLTLQDLAPQGDCGRFGRRVGPLGDFDGDGRPDLFVVAERDRRRVQSTSDWGDCPQGDNFSRGAVYVFSGTDDGFAAAPRRPGWCISCMVTARPAIARRRR